MSEHPAATPSAQPGILHSSSAPPMTIPPGHVGEFVIPGTGRRVWWTGRVAIGLLHRPERHVESTGWIQTLMIGRPDRRLSLIGQ